MHPRSAVPPELATLSRNQWGAVSTSQVEASGLSRSAVRRLVRDGQWQHIMRGVYVTHPGPLAPLARAHAGLLAAGDNAWLFGASALALRMKRAPDLPLLVAHPDAVRRAAPSWLRVVRRPAHEETGRFRGVNCSLPATGLVEAASHLSLAGLVSLTDAALATWLVKPAEIRTRVGLQTRHRAVLLGLLDAAEGGQLTELERRFNHDVITAHGLPMPTYQHRVLETGCVVDAAYEDYQLYLELDGRLGHNGVHAIRDRRRDNRHAVDGKATLRVGWYDTAGQPCAVATDVASALTARGWTEKMGRCIACNTEA